MKQLQNLKGSAILVLASLIWGLAFVAQDIASDTVPAFWFNGIRSAIGAAVLFLYLLVRKKITGKRLFPGEKAALKRTLTAGLLCGVLLTLSVNLQQWGIMLYPEGVPTSARGGFLTALYVILVPLISAFAGKKPSPTLIGAVCLAVCGIYLLCLSNGISGIYWGDLLMLACALSFAGHILTVDRVGGTYDSILLSAMQFTVCALLSCLLGLFFEAPVTGEAILSVLPAILYMGVMSSGIAYTLQIVGQKHAEPTVASIAMSLESVFSALGGWIILHNTLNTPELIGCILVFCATVLAQITPKNKQKEREKEILQ